jgi:hypothetical protein
MSFPTVAIAIAISVSHPWTSNPSAATPPDLCGASACSSVGSDIAAFALAVVLRDIIIGHLANPDHDPEAACRYPDVPL